ncbi:unnamed protein product [Fraxinus pennsylvanica]|uniref:Uncharacterized protein n=1 Tax=Fraxinus pennsylvanica TaxID=56036 RepID=A0AAD1YP67_9LAMI|nr:unnamed protein product [Fraxinus pennsylvanica]
MAKEQSSSGSVKQNAKLQSEDEMRITLMHCGKHYWVLVSRLLVPRKEQAQFLRRFTTLVSPLHVVDIDIPLNNLVVDVRKLEQVVLGRVSYEFRKNYYDLTTSMGFHGHYASPKAPFPEEVIFHNIRNLILSDCIFVLVVVV